MIKTTVRRAVPEDLEDMVVSLTEGFADDPLLTWIFKTLDQYERLAPAFFRWLTERTLDVGDGYIVEGKGALLGQPSSTADVDDEQHRKDMEELRALGGDCGDNLVAWMDAARNNHPMQTPHWYATYQGIRVAYRSEAVGASIFRYCSKEKSDMPMYLESTTPRNLGYWKWNGFERIGTFDVAEGVSLTQMWREALER